MGGDVERIATGVVTGGQSEAGRVVEGAARDAGITGTGASAAEREAKRQRQATEREERERRAQAQEEYVAGLRRRGGRASTILTGPAGLGGGADMGAVGTRRLLGQ